MGSKIQPSPASIQFKHKIFATSILFVLTQDFVDVFKSFCVFVSLHGFPVLLKVEFQWLDVVVETEGGHGEEDVLPVDRFALLSLATVTRLTVAGKI